MIEYVEWDSHFFKARIGKVVNLEQFDIRELLVEKEKNNFDRVYLFSKNKLTCSHNVLFLADEKVTFHKEIDLQIQATKYTNKYEGNITDDLIDLTLLSGHKSRFKLDLFFTHKFKDLYLKWLQNSLNKSFADEVLIAEMDYKTVGFVSVRKVINTGHIGLIAVNENHHGKGIGKDLLQAAENWYIKNNITTCEVVTQLSNRQACKFYESFGYSLNKIEYVYHI
jgi:dTDP-4-amino-4,6-dideoxy-D-galactose acyltransferase